MVEKLQALGVRLALVPTFIVLCMVPANSSSSFCPMCFANIQPLLKTKEMIMHMKLPTQKLYKSYLSHMYLLNFPNCNVSLPWLPKGNVTRKRGFLETMLQELHRTLGYVKDRLVVIRKQLNVLIHPDTSLYRELEIAQQSVTGLLTNTHCALCLKGLNPTKEPPLVRPTEPTGLFKKKVEGCQVLWNYSNLISSLAKIFKKKQDKKGRSEKRKQRRGKPVAAF